MKELVKKIEKFIKDNKLDFSGEGSELNGNCTILAGFICYNISAGSNGDEIIALLSLSKEAKEELQRVFDFAWASNYEGFWETEDAKKQYVF